MATIQKQRRNRSTNTINDTISPQNEQSNLDELAMQQLMLEPVEYEESLPKTTTTAEFLQNLNNVCLTGLDGVLRFILHHEMTLSQQQRQSNITTKATNVITSIDYTTQHLAHATVAMLSFANNDENSNIHDNRHNLTTLLDQVEKLLDHHLWLMSSQTDLCRTLLQMINTLQKTGLLNHAGHDDVIPIQHNNHYQLLRHVCTEIRYTLASFTYQLTFANKEIEAEFYQHLATLSRLVDHHSSLNFIEEHPPAYQDVTQTNHSFFKDEKPPQYRHSIDAKQHTFCSELDVILNAIDRLSHVTPRFNNQRVEKHLRMETKSSTPAPKILCDSIAQIQRVSRFKLPKRSNSAPRSTTIATKIQRRFSGATAARSDQVIENNNNNDNRHSLYEMTDLLVKSLHRPCFNKQRYQLTPDKERDLFMNGLFNKVDRLEGRRLSNQDAEQPISRFDELDQILNHICRSNQVQFENQRATFTVHSN